jgi:hypothetical protein
MCKRKKSSCLFGRHVCLTEGEEFSYCKFLCWDILLPFSIIMEENKSSPKIEIYSHDNNLLGDCGIEILCEYVAIQIVLWVE